MTYVSYSTGYKSGGVNPRPTAPTDVVPFGEESLKAYEAGIKTESFDRRLIVNAAIYQSDYKGLQISANSGGVIPSFRYSNVGSARIRGFELEADARPVPRLLFDASLGYTDFHILDLGPAAGVPGGPTLDSKPILVPTWKGQAGVQYEIPLGNLGSLTPRIQFVSQSSVYTDAANTPQGKIAPRTLWDARLGWQSRSKLWCLSLKVSNIFDKKYYINKQYEFDTIGTFRGQPGAPREFLLTARHDF